MSSPQPAGDNAAASQALRRLRAALQAGRFEQIELLAREVGQVIRALATAPDGCSARELTALQRELRALIDESQVRRDELAGRIVAARKNRHGAAAYRSTMLH